MLFTSGTLKILFPSLNNLEMIIIAIVIEVRFYYKTFYQDSNNHKFRSFFWQHIFLAFNKFLTYAIPKLPKWIIIEKSKLEYKRREALRVCVFNNIFF